MTKLCFISEFLSNDTPFYTSFNNDCIKIIHPEDFDCSTALDGIDLTQITHVAFFYHFPGHFKVPFFYEHIDDINNNFISNCLINLLTTVRDGSNHSLIVDLVSCNLNYPSFVAEIASLESSLSINFRYSVNPTGNNLGGDWIMESDGADIKDDYFTNDIENWHKVLTDEIEGTIVTGGDFTVSGDTITLNASGDGKTWGGTVVNDRLQYKLSGDDTIHKIESNQYIRLKRDMIFDGAEYTIVIESNSMAGIFSSPHTTANAVPTIDDFDNNAATVKNLTVTGGTTAKYGGFFCRSQGARNVKLENLHSTGGIGNEYAGGIVGNSAGYLSKCTITNCSSTGAISLGSGGIAGNAAAYQGEIYIDKCYSTGTIARYAGGICGRAAGHSGPTSTSYIEITNCYATGDFVGNEAGGICGSIAGYTADSTNKTTCIIDSCYYTGEFGNYSKCGGIVADRAAYGESGYGYNAGTVKITNCYSTKNVGNSSSGGILGGDSLRNASNGGQILIAFCYTKTTGVGGGIIGSIWNGEHGNIVVANCYTKANLILGGYGASSKLAIYNSYSATASGSADTVKFNSNTGNLDIDTISNADSLNSTISLSDIQAFTGFSGWVTQEPPQEATLFRNEGSDYLLTEFEAAPWEGYTYSSEPTPTIPEVVAESGGDPYVTSLKNPYLVKLPHHQKFFNYLDYSHDGERVKIDVMITRKIFSIKKSAEYKLNEVDWKFINDSCYYLKYAIFTYQNGNDINDKLIIDLENLRFIDPNNDRDLEKERVQYIKKPELTAIKYDNCREYNSKSCALKYRGRSLSSLIKISTKRGDLKFKCGTATSFNEGTYFRSYLSMIHYFNHIKEVGKGLLVDNRTLYKM